MRKLKVILLSLFTVIFFNVVEAEGSTYGHISYVDRQAAVIREDQSELTAVVNLAVAAGDQVVTSDMGRCELQFDNGTVIRLDKNTRLKVSTVLAPSFTSRWKTTTIRLLKGQVYAMFRPYNREMFRVITPNAALDIKGRSAVNIQAKDNGDTFLFVDTGKFKVMYGEDIRSIKAETARSGKGYMITAAHQMHIGRDSRGSEFKTWNDDINRKLKQHYRRNSRLPGTIYHIDRTPEVRAEKGSPLAGAGEGR